MGTPDLVATLYAGTTFRKLPQPHKAPLDERRAMALMVQQPSLIKRPVLQSGRDLLVGFRPEAYQALASSGRNGRKK